MPTSERPTTLGELKASGYRPVSVREEIHRNVARMIQAGEPILPGIVGYEETVTPELENALLAGQNVVILGERGQGKSRIVRSLTRLLDEYVPYIPGTETHDDPLEPISTVGIELVAEKGDDTPVAWLSREARYGEKLATPDVSMADLIGDVDPIKVAEGRYLSDELTIHYGLIPRTNRGIFCVNELPDLAERIQVGLFNLMEERDVQIRGYNVRLPLDIMVFATANPEDYTNRGRIITPLKDRFGSQVRTHYPLTTDHERNIIESESVRFGDDGVQICVPGFMSEIVAEISRQARRSGDVNQRSGVSVRLSISNDETLRSSALRRALNLKEDCASPRITDLPALTSSMRGKIELESFEDGREDQVIEDLTKRAVSAVFSREFPDGSLSEVVTQFESGAVATAGARVKSGDYTKLLEAVPALKTAIDKLGPNETDTETASAVEFVLEGLHLTRQLNRDVVEGGFSYRREPPAPEESPERRLLLGEDTDELRERLRRRRRQRRGDI